MTGSGAGSWLFRRAAPLVATATAMLALAGTANASLTVNYVLNGHAGYSADGLGQFQAGGTIQAEVPAGSTVQRAFLYGTYFGSAAPSTEQRTINFDGTMVETTQISGPIGCCALTTTRAEVTAQVAAKVGSGGGTTDFAINNDPSGLDGVALVVVYSNDSLPETTVAVLDGSASPAGDTATFLLAGPLDKGVSGFQAIMSLGSGFSFQGGQPGHVCGGGQTSTVDVNDRRLTSCAGNFDDGAAGNGALITVGGVGDSIDNPVDPNATSSGFDDELYNLDPFLAQGDTKVEIKTSNASNDDNLFVAVINIAAQARVSNEDCDNGIDDDGDGLIDGQDPDCQLQQPPPPPPPAAPPPPSPPPPPPPPPAPADLTISIKQEELPRASSSVGFDVDAGTRMRYTVTVTNGGPGVARNAALTLGAPDGSSFDTLSTDTGSCSGGATATCSFGTLVNGQQAHVTATATLTRAGPATVRATVSASEPDPTAANNSTSASVDVTLAPQQEPPAFGGTANPVVVSGFVCVQLPNSTDCVDISTLASIPIGSIIDARAGRVRLTVATSTGALETVELFEGMFQLLQNTLAARSTQALWQAASVTEFRLVGGDFSKCTAIPANAKAKKAKKKRKPASVEQAKPRQPVRRLWGDGDGSFRTRGRYSSATVRGTVWLTEDYCNGTLIRVREGSVTVRDLVKNRTVVVTAGKSYFAEAPARKASKAKVKKSKKASKRG